MTVSKSKPASARTVLNMIGIGATYNRRQGIVVLIGCSDLKRWDFEMANQTLRATR
jgi:hypothetical protein